jgi:hypothetical protein
MARQLKIIILVILTFFFVAGLWAIDIGASGAILDAAGYPTQAVGLLFVRTPTQQYHLGLLLSSISFLILCAMFIFEMFKGEKDGETKKRQI